MAVRKAAQMAPGMGWSWAGRMAVRLVV
jgi:hypothetical protein